ncbi:hypothetical protein EVAR_77460_1 [Eumeta japonica]|uniref:CCHC-type domain-containing protein n=1 Tax=Eumeta variegata TaxID=151549 RepID=A0A4C1ZXT5_EUMVA|nr:hypothetical protein EVAR_77460_1 [Eumeta japonica]
MNQIALHGKVEDTALMEYVIDGIKDLETNKAIFDGAADLKEFRKKLDIYSEFKKKIQTRPTLLTSYHEKRKSPTIETPKKRYYDYDNFDHQSSTCFKGVKCFKCNKFGHRRPDCHNKPKKTLNVPKEEKEEVPFKKVKIEGKEILTMIDTGSDANPMTKTEFGKIKDESFMNDIFHYYINDGIVLAYLDDLIVTAKTEEEELNKTKKALKSAEEFSQLFQYNWMKCHF